MTDWKTLDVNFESKVSLEGKTVTGQIKLKEDTKMVSDCGFNLTSVKFKVWVYPQGHGHVELSEMPGTIPASFPRKKDFDRIAEVPKIMKKMEQQLRELEEVEKDCSLCHKGLYYCGSCDHCIKGQDLQLAEIGKYLHIGVCPKCGNTRIKKVR